MAYTSEQYKYLLLKRLQRHISMGNVEERNYAYTFFGKLLDDSVVITEEGYDTFIALMDYELEYCANNNIYRCQEISRDDIESHSLFLIDAFASIGIKLEIAEEESVAIGTFTKPNGDVLVYRVTIGLNYFYINVQSNTEYNYSKLSAPYYNMENIDVLELADLDVRVCGDCYWSYDADTTTITITGNGTYHCATRDEQLGSGPYNTIIFGANVSGLAGDSLGSSGITTIVMLQPENFPLVIGSGVVSSKSTYAWDVYTDNEAFRNYAWGENVKITWHNLDEWEG